MLSGSTQNHHICIFLGLFLCKMVGISKGFPLNCVSFVTFCWFLCIFANWQRIYRWQKK